MRKINKRTLIRLGSAFCVLVGAFASLVAIDSYLRPAEVKISLSDTRSSPLQLTPKYVIDELNARPADKRKEYFDKHFSGARIRVYGDVTGSMSAARQSPRGTPITSGLAVNYEDQSGAKIIAFFDESDREVIQDIASDGFGTHVLEGTVTQCSFEDWNGDAASTQEPVLILNQSRFPELGTPSK